MNNEKHITDTHSKRLQHLYTCVYVQQITIIQSWYAVSNSSEFRWSTPKGNKYTCVFFKDHIHVKFQYVLYFKHKVI